MIRFYPYRNLLFRFLSFFLVLLLLVLPILMPYAQGIVVESAIAYGSVEIISAILIGCGIVVANADNIRDIAYEVYVWLGDHASAALDTIGTWVRQKITSIVDCGVRVSADLVDLIRQAVSDLTATDASGNTAVSTLSLPDGVPSYDDFLNVCIPQMAENGYSVPSNLYVPDGVMYFGRPSYGQGVVFYFCFDSYFKMDSSKITGARFLAMCQQVSEQQYEASSSKEYYFYYGDSYWLVYDGLNQIKSGYGFSLDLKSLIYCSTDIVYGDYSVPASGVSIPYTGTVSDPREDTMIRVPDIPEVQLDEEGKDIVIYPDLSVNPADHVADIPTTELGDLVDVPYDVLVDVATGTAVGEGETDIPDVPSGTLPESGDLSLPKLIISKFPFCIPFDVATMIGQLNAEPEPLVIRIPVKTVENVPTQYITIDFSQYESIIQVVRWGIYALFLAGLAYVTRNYIKW